MAQEILCYGDSNTWGCIPVTDIDHVQRYDEHTRWGGVLRDTLGEGYRVMEEGLGGRTTVFEDPVRPNRNGYPYLMPCLESHQPLDLVMVMLGTNDLKHRFGKSAYDIASGAAFLVETILASATGRDKSAPQVLLICPPPTAMLSPIFVDMFEGGYEKSRQLAPFYRDVAQDFGVHFLDAGEVISPAQ